MNRWIVVALCVGAVVVQTLAGPLTPPAGAPSSTAKPLGDIEPRTAIRQAQIPLVISQPGSYYLAESVTFLSGGSTTDVIRITASDVTLDLNGFTIDGAEVDFTTLRFGVRVQGDRVRVHNGNIRRVRQGVGAQGRSEVTFESLTIAHLSLGIYPSNNGRVLNCRIVGGFSGVDVQSVTDVIVRDCFVVDATEFGFRSNFGINTVFENCTASNCGTGFIATSGAERISVIDCEAFACFIGFQSNGVATNVFLRNLAVGCTNPYSSVTNTSTNPATANPWANLAQ